jgi:DNA helicase-2/ATP-dependent DNA helicase PcrA
LEVELSERDIPFHKYGGLKFVESAHVKDLVAFLRVLENPRDEVSWYRILNLLEGVGPKTTRFFLGQLAEREFDLKKMGEILLPAAARKQYEVLSKMFASILTDGEKLALASQIERIRQVYEPMIPLNYDNPEPRIRDMGQLEQIAERYKSRRNFIDALSLDPPNATGDYAGPGHKDDDWLTLSTMHSAKGCEWQVVFIIHAADGNIPSDMAIGNERDAKLNEDGLEEERRLFYVALTRAKDHLYVMFPLRYYFKRYPMGDGHSYAQLTRFLTPEIAPLLDVRMADAYGMGDQPLDLQTEMDIRLKISESWR